MIFVRACRPLVCALSLIGLLAAASPVRGQFGAFEGDGSGGLFGAGGGGDEVAASARFAISPGQTSGRIFITAKMKPNWHIYSITQEPGGPVRTKIKLESSDAYRVSGDYYVSPPPERKKEPAAFGDLPIETHHGTVTWFAQLELSEGVDPATLEIKGELSAQPCDPNTCLPSRPFPFTARLGEAVELADAVPAAVPPPPVEPQSAAPPVEPGPAAPARHDGELPWQPFTTIRGLTELTGDGVNAFDAEKTKAALAAQVEGASLNAILRGILFGFIGGMILNVMPCVLPVIGLKILSFIEQAGHDRRKAFMLNVWYSLGLLSFFLVLATLAVIPAAGLGWGELMSYSGFTIPLAAVVFVMGLSFFGVWEIPIPGFAGRGKAVEVTEKEGAGGAFAKGVLTTILATPCSAPFLAPALTWALVQPPLLTYAVFISVGLGMASPYLLLGAFPQLLRFLPKPGAWMDTFKQLMGFVLLGTVVFIFTFLEVQYVVPAIGLLFGLWAACWWIGRTPPTARRSVKVRAWLEAVAFAGGVWIITFPGLASVLPHPLNFRGLAGVMESRLERKIDTAVAIELAGLERPGDESGPKTVLIDFTADWCLTCKALEATVLNTRAVRDLVEKNGVVTLHADWTHKDPVVTEMLETLGSKQVPTLAIFPAGRPNQPIVKRGGYTQAWLLGALQRAGPSKRPSRE